MSATDRLISSLSTSGTPNTWQKTGRADSKGTVIPDRAVNFLSRSAQMSSMEPMVRRASAMAS